MKKGRRERAFALCSKELYGYNIKLKGVLSLDETGGKGNAELLLDINLLALRHSIVACSP